MNAMFHNSNTEFAFSDSNLVEARSLCQKYPRKSSALLPLLILAQKQEGWLPKEALDYVADFLCIPRMKAYEVASFYTMLRLKRVGKYHIQLCRTTPCWLRGSDCIRKKIEDTLGISAGETTNDNLFTLDEVECLGACINAPVVQINDDYYEDLTPDSVESLLHDLANKQE